MNVRKVIALTVAAGTAVFVSASFLLTQDKPQEAGFEMDEMTMKRMMPGAMHEYLAPLEGDWTMMVKMRMAPEAPWEESEAEASREWVLDGRFIKETVEGDFGGMPFEGIGYTGYDNVRQEFVSTWMDSMGTGIMVSAGQASKDGKTITFECHASCPMTGDKDKWSKSVIRIKDDESHVFEMYAKGPDGKEYKSMEIVCEKD